MTLAELVEKEVRCRRTYVALLRAEDVWRNQMALKVAREELREVREAIRNMRKKP